MERERGKARNLPSMRRRAQSEDIISSFTMNG